MRGEETRVGSGDQVRLKGRKISSRKFFPSSPESDRGLCAAHQRTERIASKTEKKHSIQCAAQKFKF